MRISSLIIRTVASMSPQQREDMYLTLALSAADRGNTREESIWLYHAEHRTTWQELEKEK